MSQMGRSLAEAKAAKAAGKGNYGKDLSKLGNANTIRDIELSPISEGEIVVIPTDWTAYEMPVGRTGQTAVKIITEEGKDFWLGCLTRSAMPVGEDDPSKRVMPKGNVIDFVQKCDCMQTAINGLAGLKIKFVKKTPVNVQFEGQANPRNVNVWEIVTEDKLPELNEDGTLKK